VDLFNQIRDKPYVRGMSMSYEKKLANLKSNLSKNIKKYRKEMGLAQERLALEAGVDRTLVSKIEREIGNPSIEILFKISIILDVSISELLSD
jgi:DNA-binding XRE family transcriptional regulator